MCASSLSYQTKYCCVIAQEIQHQDLFAFLLVGLQCMGSDIYED